MKLLAHLEEALDRERRVARKSARALYARIIEASRKEYFYRNRGVPDTLDGRFELLMLHTVLVCRRLAAAAEQGIGLSQNVFDAMIDDLDVNLRELGVNEPSLGMRIKEMARAFYGRLDAYAAALDGGHRRALEEAVIRNLYGTVEKPVPENVAWAADYIERTAALFHDQDMEAARKGALRFADPAA
ncbi:MAG: hypothetical protein OXD42_11465 [Rhodospirillaceae bacterium]|nr:hypothetical protein [Rhodospirillaceae bacterium]